MALESATYINELNVANPTSTDSVAQADDHIRLIKAAIKTTFPNITGPVTATQSEINQPIPSGLIVMWSGATNAIPTGWHLCDGSNNTPDLRNRFIVGVGSNYAVGDKGGSAFVTLTEAQIPSHTHGVSATTASSGSHTHSITDPGHTHSYTNVAGTGALSVGAGYGQATATSGSSTTGISVASGGAHTHTINTTSSTAGSGAAHENRPPYYALCFIMKA